VNSRIAFCALLANHNVNHQLTDVGSSVAPDLSKGVAGPPFGGEPGPNDDPPSDSIQIVIVGFGAFALPNIAIIIGRLHPCLIGGGPSMG
jgi:hypothetical protein